MSIQRLGPDELEGFTLQVNPSRTFSSSSLGITGSVKLYARSSPVEKETSQLSLFLEDTHVDDSMQTMLQAVRESSKVTTDISSQMAAYMSKVNSTARSEKKQQEIEIVRFEPSFNLTKDTLRKNVVQNTLYPYYRHSYHNAHWAYTNYHSLNFFTASCVPSNSVLLYPNSASTSDVNASGVYTLDDAFTFEFYVNPRYTTDGQFKQFHAGTILHLSSSYAVSIVTGSSRDELSRPNAFRILLQISGGADTRPSLATSSTPLAFFSADNSLRLNNWHYVAIRWSATANNKTGSFVIDNEEAGTFVIPYESIKPAAFSLSSNPDVLCLGNYYEGNNAGTNAQSRFFNQNIAQREGLVQLINDGDATTNTPATFSFNHPLKAEIHEIKIYSYYRSLQQISASALDGPANADDMLFYVPPMFVRESPVRQPYGTNGVGWSVGGVQQTPFASYAGTTSEPFNAALSFGVGGKMINLENFTRDFATKNYPRLLHLSGVEIGTTTTDALSANSLLYDEVTNFHSGSIRKRNVTVLPNDNGLFRPNYILLASSSLVMRPVSGSVHEKFVNDLSNLDLSLISLNSMIPSSTFDSISSVDSGTLFDAIAGASPDRLSLDPGAVYSIVQRTRDTSSNEVTFFDISNIFYGKRILPNSFSVTDNALTGTNGRVSITLKDNGHGSLYRADSLTPHATWNSVGNIFYNEGIVVVKTPSLPFFGKDQFSLSLKGEQNIHIMRINVIARAGEINSSSNPSYMITSASTLAHETDGKFVYITGLNFHDDNLNVIMKTKLAQPVIKRAGDRFLFRPKIDF